MTENKEKKKVVALLSGGLDSQLAVQMMQKQGFEVSAVAIKTPFCDFDCGRGCGFEIRERADTLGINLKTVYLGDEYIEMLKNPKHGFGSGMNPCIDCRAMMFDAAKKQMEEIGAEFIISGEVLGQRPMSQHGPALRTIEKESNLEREFHFQCPSQHTPQGSCVDSHQLQSPTPQSLPREHLLFLPMTPTCYKKLMLILLGLFLF